VATKCFELKNHAKNNAQLKHCIISSSKQFIGKIRKPNLKYLLNFMSLNCAKYQQKNLQYLKVLFHKSFVDHWIEKFIRHSIIEKNYLSKKKSSNGHQCVIILVGKVWRHIFNM